MTVTDGPRAVRPEEPSEKTETPEVLIPEARQRARRRRTFYAFAVLLALVGAMLAFLGRTGPPPDVAALDSPAADAPAVATGPDASASVIAHHGIFHVGWVLVYDDGRVLGLNERDPHGRGLVQRRLNAGGVELVRSGALHPGALFFLPTPEHNGAWAEPDFTAYTPAAYAACFVPPGMKQKGMAPALADLRALQNGRERTYAEVNILSRQFDPWVGPNDCFEITAQEAPEVLTAIRNAGFMGLDAPDGPYGCVEISLGLPVLCFHPVLPHGSWVLWGG